MTVSKSERLAADLLLIGDSDGEQWLGVRIVNQVDGRSVLDSAARIQSILSQAGPDRLVQLKALAAESARMNLGESRNVNLPLVPLQLLDAADESRYAYHGVGTKKIRGVECVGLQFSETARPTIIRTFTGDDLAASGVAWIEPERGAIHRVELRLSPVGRGGSQPTTMSVDFSYDSSLGMLVPVEMRETFAASGGPGDGVAHYDNFRRFETHARIKQWSINDGRWSMDEHRPSVIDHRSSILRRASRSMTIPNASSTRPQSRLTLMPSDLA